ncbi:MAG: ABC transporter ATP-binding protein [Paludibacter sp.]|nr:ABC transporter ATP-binding protein [Paludibacter sp.]MDD4198006.1 ABC transporter ATP-binding protein [Paludibacter sp.]MDD4428576.1 ABC transporter ATP-binding protein [Paludibacter sp.]
MHKIISIFKRFLPPYKKYVVWSLIFNFLATIFSLFSFAALIPVLQILFGIKKLNVVYMPWSWDDSLLSLVDATKNNFSFYLNLAIQNSGVELTLLFIGLFLIVMTAFKTGTAYLGVRMTIPLRTGVVRDLKNTLYRKIVSLPIGYFTEERKGDIMSRMSSDVNEVEISILNAVDMIFKNPVMIIIYLGVMVLMSWELTIFVMLLLPISGWLIGIIGKNLKRRSTEVQEQQGEMLSQMDETIGGLRVVKAFNAESKIEARFATLNERMRKSFFNLHARYNLAAPLSEFVGTVVIAILLWFGGVLIVGERSSIGPAEFIYYLVIFYSIINPAKELSRAFYGIRKGMAALDRIDKILNTENNIPEPKKPIEITGFHDKIEFKGLSFRYQSEWVLKDISLTVPKGKTIALVGQSGSGKTTLIDLFPRFYEVKKGEILLDGVNIKKIRSQDIRKLIGNVNQEAILFNDTFFNNIAFGVEEASKEQVIEAAKIANAHGFIMATENGYETTIGDRGSKLSGGQRQRISIARAILKNPPILILDEATSALDTESEKMVQKALESLMKNRTTLVVAHRLSTIKKADEICVLHEGRIVERGKHDELIELNGYYKKLVDMQSF